MLQDVSMKNAVGVKARGLCLPQAVGAAPGLTLRGSLCFGKQLAHTRLGFVLFWALLVLMFFLGLAGLGAGGFPFGFGGLLRLVRPLVCFLSWIVLCCSRSLSSHCWEAICKHDCPVHLTPVCYQANIRINETVFTATCQS